MIDTAQPEGRGKGCLYSRRGRKSDTYNTERGVRFMKVDLSFFLNKRDGECHSIARTLSLCPCFSSFCSKTSIPAGQHCKQVLTHLPAPCSLPLTCPAGGLGDLWAAILSLAGWVGLNKVLIPSASPAEWGSQRLPYMLLKHFLTPIMLLLGKHSCREGNICWSMEHAKYGVCSPYTMVFFLFFFAEIHFTNWLLCSESSISFFLCTGKSSHSFTVWTLTVKMSRKKILSKLKLCLLSGRVMPFLGI